MLPKEGGEVTLVRVADLGANRDKGQIRLGQELLRARHPALQHIVLRCPPGGVLEQGRKVVRAQLDDGSERGQG